MPDHSADGGGGGGGRSITEHGRRLRNHLLLLLPQRRDPQIPADRDRLLPAKKKGFAAAAFRGLGCTASSAQVHAPAAAAVSTASDAAAAVRSSADWQGKRTRTRRKKSKSKKKEREKERRSQLEAPIMSAAEMWCAPGIGFSSAANAAVDCVAPSVERIQREDRFSGRRGGGSYPEQLSSLLDSPESSPFDIPIIGAELIPPRHLQRARRIRRSPGGLDEIMMFQARLMLGEIDTHDRYRDWRLDVDSMSYEELLELGERIGYVSTGLREDEIFGCLRKVKHTVFNSSQCRFSTELERKCSICQEEYEANDEVGKLECGHSYHMYCIKQWLLRKNACPVCKATVAKS